MSSLRVCAVIIHYGDPAPADHVVQQLLAQSDPPMAVVVVSNDGTNPISRAHSAVTVLIAPRNLGYAGGINFAAAEAIRRSADLIWILNPDVELRPGALKMLVEARERLRPMNVDIIGSIVTSNDRVWYGGGNWSMRTGRAWHVDHGERIEPVGQLVSSPVIVRTNWVNGCSMLIPLESFRRRGGFDEHFFLHKEELEWQLRKPHADAFLVCEPLVDHRVGGSTGSTHSRLGATFMARNGLILALRQPPLKRLAWVASWLFDYVLRPAAKGKLRMTLCAVRSVRYIDRTGEEVLKSI